MPRNLGRAGEKPLLAQAPQLGEGEGGSLPCPILKIRKKCPDFVKNILIQSIFELCDIVSFWLLRGKSGLNLKSIVFIVHFS